MSPSSGARSGTRPKRPAPAGDGRIMRRVALRCGHAVEAEAQPIAVANGKRFYTCPVCQKLEAAR